jgi:hypothetical protein
MLRSLGRRQRVHRARYAADGSQAGQTVEELTNVKRAGRVLRDAACDFAGETGLTAKNRKNRTIKTKNPRLRTTFALCALLALAGCKSIGPGTIARDRFDYSAGIGDSWKRQTLLNIVKLRYFDPPIFVDVGQIVASRSLSRSVNVGGTFGQGNDNNMSLGAAGIYTDQPTVTYTPLTGNKFIKSLMTPLPPESVFFMIQSGMPADGVLFAAVSSINGLKNQSSTIHGTVPPDPDFLRALALMRKIQEAGGVALRVERDAQKQATSILALRRPDISPEAKEDSLELRRLLRLDPNASEFKLVFGTTAANDKEVAVATRSIIQLMGTMAAEVEVPAQDLAEHRVAPGWESAADAREAHRLIEIHSSKTNPPRAFVAVNYRDQWFWIDDCDLKSKRVFSLMMLLFTLADTGETPALPLITIPAR